MVLPARQIKIMNTVTRGLVESQAEVQALYELHGSATIPKTTDEEKDKLAREYRIVCTKNAELFKAYEDEKEELAHFTKNFLIDRTPLPPWGTKIGRLDQPQVIVKVESEDVSEMGSVKMESLTDSFQVMQGIEEEGSFAKEDESDQILDESTSEGDIPGFLNDQLRAIVKDQAENQDFSDEQLSPPDQDPIVEFAEIPDDDDYSAKMQDVEVPLSDGFLENLSLESPLARVERDGYEFEL
ncbi:hypothetical protein B0J14DRAFT_238315 [Halenospora varia]|nr:hypothetical protein B0J14DRAFT_238315 [Halenospora varia]